MIPSLTLALYGSCAARRQAQALLENRPEIKRLDASQDAAEVRLVFAEPLPESELLPLLASSGISGFRYVF